MNKNSNLLIFVPTYNERDNIGRLYDGIRKHAPQADLLFLDDASPDGTGKLLDELAVRDGHMVIIHRAGKLGIGSAHIIALNYAKEQAYEFLLTMDADFTHDPQYIPSICAKSDSAEIIIGSRYAHGGRIDNWPLRRRVLTRVAHFMTSVFLGLPHDCTGAYRLYRLSVLNSSEIKRIGSEGYSFFIESLFRLKRSGMRVAEVPIIAQDRSHGVSKISKKEIFKAVRCLLRLSLQRLWLPAQKDKQFKKGEASQ